MNDFKNQKNYFIFLGTVMALAASSFDAQAATLTEKLKTFLNGDMPKTVKSIKLDSIEVMPFRTITVNGDAAKFRAINWMNDGVTGGIKDMKFTGDIGDGKHLDFEGHAIPGDNDYNTSLKLTKEETGYITMDFGNFRKWYDVYGGYFPGFSTSKAISRMTFDPYMDMGHFNFEIGKGEENDPDVALSYSRDTKDGTKSKLTWGGVTEGATTRKIYPSWEEESIVTDSIALKGKTNISGFDVHGKQLAEFYYGRTIRTDDNHLTSSSTPVQTHAEEPFSKRLVSTLQADRWMLNDKNYLAFDYQYQHLRTNVLETIAIYNTAGALASSSTNRTTDAKDERDSHAWVQHFYSQITPDFSLTTKLKEEIISQSGSGLAKVYNGPASDRTLASENQVTNIGESLSLRYNGISKTSVYSDWDFQQGRNWIWKERVGTSAYSNVDRGSQWSGVLGYRFVPNSKFNINSQIRHKVDNDTLNTLFNTDGAITISRLDTKSNELSNKFTWNITKRLQHSFRLQLYDNIYKVQSLQQTGFAGNTDWLKSQMNSRVFTYDIVVQPWDQWMFDVGASINNAKVSTPASQTAVSGGGIPVFTANVYTLLVSTSYSPKENVSLYSSAQYSRADNYDAKGFAGLPYGINNEEYNINLGIQWSPKADFTIEPHYGYYAYTGNPNGELSLDYGDYSAHVAWFDASLKF